MEKGETFFYNGIIFDQVLKPDHFVIFGRYQHLLPV